MAEVCGTHFVIFPPAALACWTDRRARVIFNPIENVWSLSQRKVSDCGTLDEVHCGAMLGGDPKSKGGQVVPQLFEALHRNAAKRRSLSQGLTSQR